MKNKAIKIMKVRKGLREEFEMSMKRIDEALKQIKTPS